MKPAPLPQLDPSQVTKDADDAPQEIQAQDGLVPVPDSTNYWKLASIILGSIWILTLLGWWLTRNRRNVRYDNNEQDQKIKNVIRDLKQACATNQPQRARELLLLWGKLHWPDDPPMNLGEIKNRSSSTLRDEINRLSHVLYGKGNDLWEGSVFWQAFDREQTSNKSMDKTSRGDLEPLYRI